MEMNCGQCEYMGVDEAGHADCSCLGQLPPHCYLLKEKALEDEKQAQWGSIHNFDSLYL